MTRTNDYAGTMAIGLALVVLGVLFFVQQFFHLVFWQFTLPLLIIAVGAVCLAGIAVRGREVGWLAVPGSMFVVLGLVLLFQVVADYWASWAYAWALVAPGATGLGLAIWGRLTGRPVLMQIGAVLALAGLFIFVVFGGFFELVFGILGYTTPGRFIVPVALILVGFGLLVGRSLARWFVSTQLAPMTDLSALGSIEAQPQQEQTKEVTARQNR